MQSIEFCCSGKQQSKNFKNMTYVNRKKTG